MKSADWIAIAAAIVAVVAALASWRQVRHAKDQANSAQDQAATAKESYRLQEELWRDAVQPYVYVDIRPDPRNGQMLLLVIENSGRSVAKNVRVTFNPPLRSANEKYEKIGEKTALKEGIPAIPPNGRIMHFLDIGFELAKADIPKSYTINVTGEGPAGELEPLEYVLDLNALLLEGPVLAEGTIHELSRAISNLAKKINP
ncbi:hypothetical protein E1200_29770 [Actinomadura sp. GC306]|uniref:hypothetical protein n=1 Tax=Actinomadura sp. GC306 TaxID=2530367 RepID=UPI001049098C|nr:hypothetical protein [Actinomadura sp. GC306]TDC60874.1 hypothetical protein E1200_29770 [Actinomadura sp. GC306]